MKVLIPVITRSLKIFGVLTIALSIVAVVTESNEVMFWSSLEELITWVLPILKDDRDAPLELEKRVPLTYKSLFTVVIPAA